VRAQGSVKSWEVDVMGKKATKSCHVLSVFASGLLGIGGGTVVTPLLAVLSGA